VISAARLRPFPWSSLDSTTRREAQAMRGLREWLERHVRLEAVGRSLATVLRADVAILVRRVQPLAEARAIEDATGVVVAPAETPTMRCGTVLEFESALATAIVSRGIERPTPSVVHPGPPSVGIAGALGAIVAATARRAHANVALRVVAAGPARALEADLARLEPDLLAATATVLVANEAFLARLVVPGRVASTSPPAISSSNEMVAALGPVELAVPIVASASRARVADIASVRPGDVWLSGSWPLERGPNGQIFGRVMLSAPGSEHGVRAELGVDGRLVLGGELEAVCAPEVEMGESAEKNGLMEAVGEVPVIVRVEIGEARMAAREWASLGRGDVLALGRRIGEPVILRVGGVAVARGDLVEIDGEVGVRIAERIAAMGSPQ
jgi:flagellar motor switch/type III secretory pathway protein FliN